MNRTKIEWTDYSWNPVVGCKNNCWYCYARRINQRFKIIPNWEEPKFTHNDDYYAPFFVKKPSKIFVCSMGELFGDWIPDEWIEAVIHIVKKCPQHTFQFLTKNPLRYADFNFPRNCWLGFTNTGADNKRMIEFYKLSTYNLKFVSYEPLLHRCDCSILKEINWIIVGAMTGPRSQHYQPKVEWVEDIIKQARTRNVPIFLKDNLKWSEKIQEFPEP